MIGKWLVGASQAVHLRRAHARHRRVGAKAEIFALIDSLVRQGAGVLLISSELPEIINVCDRTYVMRGGRIAGELAHGEMTEERILQLGMNDA
ncbi:hypothetical protein ACU4GD_22480 [Cupriavidus basilensis]